VFIAFEETAEELTANVRSLGFDLDKLVAQQKLLIDHVVLDGAQIEENGEYDLDGLFIRLGYAIDSIGAKRVVLDTIETLFGGFATRRSCAPSCAGCSAGSRTRASRRVITAERGEGR
jgi:circadian clock protein KaiC